VKQLDDNLRYIIIAKRLEDKDVFKQNIYETGDFVLRRGLTPIRKNKLTIRWAKPYIGIHNHKVKDVTCKYLATDVGYVSYVERYNVFIDINTNLFHAIENDVDEPREFVYRLTDAEENIAENHRQEILEYCLATVLPTDTVGLGDIFVHGKYIERLS
jgi:hypothetical protein